MNEVRSEFTDGRMTLFLSGHIDSNNAPQVETEIKSMMEGKEVSEVVIDVQDLKYISSAGLRVLLHLIKSNGNIRVINVVPEVYEIFDMTGFTQMITVEKAYRKVSIEGCEVIGWGANGTIYRIDKDNVVKVYNNADALSEIQHEREVARLALILGIPTAISYDVVKVGDSYGSVFELLNARSFAKIMADEPEKIDWCIHESVELLKKIHSTEVPEGKLPDMKETALGWAEFMKDHLSSDKAEKLFRLISEIPHDNHMIHGDYHVKNIELQGDEVLLIDMDTLSVGHPIFELAFMYNSYVAFGEIDKDNIKRFLGFDSSTAQYFWKKSLAEYLGTDDERKITEVENKARIIGYTRVIRRSIRRGGLEDAAKKAEIDLWTEKLEQLLDNTDTLLFSQNELDIEALTENLPQVLDFVNNNLEKIDCPVKEQMQIAVAVEEIFVNIANYAYNPETGKAVVRVEVTNDPVTVVITFIDQGMPYDPLAKEDPDITLPANERAIGGLGIFMVKNMMDDISYEYKDGSNILRIKKSL